MRKLAPVFFSTLIALGSAAALAGDMNKTAETTPSPTNDTNISSRSGTSDSASPAPSASLPATEGSMAATPDKSKVKSKKKQVARNDMRCDQSASRAGKGLPTPSDSGLRQGHPSPAGRGALGQWVT